LIAGWRIAEFLMIDAQPPMEIVARLAGPAGACVIQYQRNGSEAGDVTRVRCGARSRVIARSDHGASVRRVSRCAVMLTVEGVRFPRLFQIGNCGGALQVRELGKVWTHALLAEGRIAPARLDRVIYYPVADRPACYRVSIVFTPQGKTTNSPLNDRSSVRCAGAERPA
jgi:hypothetical protein